jgi:hypothetical protein
MSAATANRNTSRRNADQVGDPVAAATTIYGGTMYALSATGFAVPAGTAGSGKVRAVAEIGIDNSIGADGDDTVSGRLGCFRFDNSADTDLIARADIGGICYVVDDSTVAKTDNAGARQIAGAIVDVDDAGVWVLIGAGAVGPQGPAGA